MHKKGILTALTYSPLVQVAHAFQIADASSEVYRVHWNEYARSWRTNNQCQILSAELAVLTFWTQNACERYLRGRVRLVGDCERGAHSGRPLKRCSWLLPSISPQLNSHHPNLHMKQVSLCCLGLFTPSFGLAFGLWTARDFWIARKGGSEHMILISSFCLSSSLLGLLLVEEALK